MPISKIAVFYFSGTGSNRAVSERFSELCGLQSIRAELFAMEDCFEKPIDFSSFQAVALFYPVYAFDAPSLVHRFIKKVLPKNLPLPLIDGRVCGNNPGHFFTTRASLRQKAIRSQIEIHLRGIYNMYFDDSEEDKVRYGKKTNEDLKILLRDFISGKTRRFKSGFFPLLYGLSIAPVEKLGVFLLIKRFFKVEETCNACGLCVKHCPDHHLALKRGRPQAKVFTSCEFCLRCVAVCPKKAIRPRILAARIHRDFPDFSRYLKG